jgi:hypothetical protein
MQNRRCNCGESFELRTGQPLLSIHLLDPIFLSFVRHALSVRAPVLPIRLFLFVFQTDLSPITVLCVFAVDAVQLKLVALGIATAVIKID